MFLLSRSFIELYQIITVSSTNKTSQKLSVFVIFSIQTMYKEQGLSEILSVSEVAEILRYGKNMVYYLLDSGELKGFRINEKGNYRISRAAVNEYIKKQSKL